VLELKRLSKKIPTREEEGKHIRLFRKYYDKAIRLAESILIRNMSLINELVEVYDGKTKQKYISGWVCLLVIDQLVNHNVDCYKTAIREIVEYVCRLADDVKSLDGYSKIRASRYWVEISTKDLAEIPNISIERSHVVFAELRKRFLKAQDQVILLNYRHIHNVAVERYRVCHGHTIPIEDLAGYCVIGAIKALRKFDLNRKVKFITYAHYFMRSEASNANDNCYRLIRIPISQKKKAIDIFKHISELERDGRSGNVLDKIADFKSSEMSLEVGKIRNRLLSTYEMALQNTVDIYRSSDVDGIRLIEKIACPESTDKSVIRKELTAYIIHMFESNLSVLDSVILKLYLGFQLNEVEYKKYPIEVEDELNWAEISRRVGYSKQHISNRKREALTTLKSIPSFISALLN